MPFKKAERRRKIFLETRSVWGEEDSHVWDRPQVSRFVTRHRSRLAQAIRDSNESSVIDTILNFIREGVLDSEFKAKLTFPELFHPSPERSLQHEVSEQEAVQSEADALHKAVHGSQTVEPVQDKPESQLPQAQNGTPQASRMTLFPLYLSMPCQHRLLNLLQKQLEECCFEFAKHWMPDLLVKRNWSCAIAVELNHWAQTIPQQYEVIPREATTAQTAQSLRNTFEGTVHIRHAAVHRLRTNAKEVDKMLQEGIQLTQMLKDGPRAIRLEILKQHLMTTTKNLELHKNSLEGDLDCQLTDIASCRMQLDREEEEARASIRQQDEESTERMSAILFDSMSHFEAADDSNLSKENMHPDESDKSFSS